MGRKWRDVLDSLFNVLMVYIDDIFYLSIWSNSEYKPTLYLPHHPVLDWMSLIQRESDGMWSDL